MRMLSFARRNIKELLRDPLSYVFCLGFPIVMLVVMTVVDSTIPSDPMTGVKYMDIFTMPKLVPGIAVFGLSFIMLFAALSVSKDRSTALITRLRTSPMTPFDFIVGYMLPLLVLSVAQLLITVVCGMVIGAFAGSKVSIGRSFILVPALFPSAVFFTGLGMIFGTLLSYNAAPPCSSIIITLCGMLGGIWFSLDTVPEGNFFGVLCDVLPFRYPVDLGRAILTGDGEWLMPLLVSLAYGAVTVTLAVVAFRIRMNRESR